MYISGMGVTAAGSDCPFLPSEGFSRAGFLTRDHRVSVAFPRESMLPLSQWHVNRALLTYSSGGCSGFSPFSHWA